MHAPLSLHPVYCSIHLLNCWIPHESSSPFAVCSPQSEQSEWAEPTVPLACFRHWPCMLLFLPPPARISYWINYVYLERIKSQSGALGNNQNHIIITVTVEWKGTDPSFSNSLPPPPLILFFHPQIPISFWETLKYLRILSSTARTGLSLSPDIHGHRLCKKVILPRAISVVQSVSVHPQQQ